MSYSRLLRLYLILANRGRMTASQLSAELEISERQVHRDIESLQIAQVPVYSVKGPGGGFELMAGHRVNLAGLTEEQIEALLLLGLAGPAAELGLKQTLLLTEEKLLSGLPAELRPKAGKVRERFLLDPPGWFREGDPVPYLQSVAKAVWDSLYIEMRYKSWSGVAECTVEPWAVVLKGGSWYMVGADVSADDTRAEIRVYRVSRIESMMVGADTFSRPRDFDLASYWEKATARWETSLYEGDVTLRMSPVALERVGYLLGPEAERAALDTAGEADAHGWKTAMLAAELLPNRTADLLQFGGEVEVLEPTDLRTALVEQAASMTRLYRKSGSSSK